MWHKKIVVAGIATALIAGLAACSESKADDDVAKSDSATKVTIVLSNKANQSYLPLILADKLGYFKKQGLNVTIKELQETQQVNSAILAGDAQAAVKFYDSNVVLQAKGKDVVSVLQLLQAPGMVGIARPDAKVKSGKDLSGKTLGVTGLGSATASIAQYLAIHNGVEREKIKL